MKIIVESKKDGNICIAHDLGKALSVKKTENLPAGGKLLSIDYETRGYAYSDNDCIFFMVEVSADFTVYKTKTAIPRIIEKFAAEA